MYVIGAELCTWKFADFQKRLLDQGVARPFTGKENVSFLDYFRSRNIYSHTVAIIKVVKVK